MSFQSDLRTALTSDTALSTILTGGWFDGENLPREGMTMSKAPKLPDGVTLAPFGVIRRRGMNDEGIRDLNAERGSVELYIYADKGYATIETAISRLKVVLNERNLVGSDASIAFLRFMYASGELVAEELAHAPFKFVRFNLIYRRK